MIRRAGIAFGFAAISDAVTLQARAPFPACGRACGATPELRAPTIERLQDLPRRIITRIMKWLTLPKAI